MYIYKYIYILNLHAVSDVAHPLGSEIREFVFPHTLASSFQVSLSFSLSFSFSLSLSFSLLGFAHW